jgi:hypothetical protein
MYSSQKVPGSQSPFRQKHSVPRLISDLSARTRSSPGPGGGTLSRVSAT